MKESPDIVLRRGVLAGVAASFAALTVAGTLARNAVSAMPPRILVTNALVALAFLAVPVAATRKASPPALALVVMLGVSLLIYNGGMLAGGINAPICALMPLLPMVGFCFGGTRLGGVGLGLVLLGIAWLALAERLGLTAPVIDPATVSGQRATMLAVIGAAAFAIGATYEAARRRAEQHLVEISRLASLGTMAAGIAHEINNPLAILAGHAQRFERLIAEGGASGEETAALAARVLQMSKRMAKTVSGLRAYARDDSDQPLAPVAVAAIVEDVRALSEERFRAAGIALRIGAVPESLRIMARPVQVAQVLLNLLDNSYDAVAGQEPSWIAIDCAEKGEAVELAVTDSGRGIPKELRARIFAPFFTTKEVGRGTGLGLSIAAGIMAGHHGDLTLDERAANTRFVLRFPRAPVT